jgi:hypothetical protein
VSSFNSISADKLWRLVGVPHGPALIDVRSKDAFAAEPRFIPGAIRRSHETASSWAREFTGRSRSARTDAAKAKALQLGCASAGPLQPKFLQAAMRLGRKRVSRSSPKASCRSAISRGEQCG